MRRTNRTIPPLSKQDILRFWEKVRIRGVDECWPWTAARDQCGYGQFGLGSRSDGSNDSFPANRVAWTIACGPVPVGLCVLHHCDNPPCQNPRHLWLGTRADNTFDMDRKGRRGYQTGNWGDKNGAHTHPECVLRGEQCPWSKMNARQVRKIRRRYAVGGISMRSLAGEHGVSISAIHKIVHYTIWAHDG